MLAHGQDSPAVARSQDRDLRIDFFRGLALLFIFIDHIPGNTLGHFTLRNFAFADAAEAFVLIAGISAAFAYGKGLDRPGVSGMKPLASRLVKIYQSHLLLVALGVALIMTAAWYFENPLYIEHINLTPFWYDPFGALWKTALLYHQIGYLNILPLYIVLLLWLPILWKLLRIHLALGLATSVGIWLLARQLRLNLPAYPDAFGWYFNPLTWQLLFTLGVTVGLLARRGVALPRSRWLIGVAALYAAAALIVMAPWVHISGLEKARLVPYDAFGHFWKTEMPLQRLLSILAVAYLIAVTVRPNAGWFSAWPARIVIACGRNALDIFFVGTLLSFAGFVVLMEAGRSWGVQLIVNAAGIAVLGWLGWYLTECKQRVVKSPAPASTVVPAVDR
ncbi:MAG TPA: OpgC domain-containing protein [Hyphomicrobiaceae bacterium]|nr:OpgC domain-containing protein [Hyphomicrobiaceae bacterium]